MNNYVAITADRAPGGYLSGRLDHRVHVGWQGEGKRALRLKSTGGEPAVPDEEPVDGDMQHPRRGLPEIRNPPSRQHPQLHQRRGLRGDSGSEGGGIQHDDVVEVDDWVCGRMIWARRTTSGCAKRGSTRANNVPWSSASPGRRP